MCVTAAAGKQAGNARVKPGRCFAGCMGLGCVNREDRHNLSPKRLLVWFQEGYVCLYR